MFYDITQKIFGHIVKKFIEDALFETCLTHWVNGWSLFSHMVSIRPSDRKFKKNTLER